MSSTAEKNVSSTSDWSIKSLGSDARSHDTVAHVTLMTKRDTTSSIVVIWVKILQTELVIEIYSKSQVRAIGKVLLVKFSWNTN